MKRREFIGLLGIAGTWPNTVRAAQPAQQPRIGVLFPGSPDTAYGKYLAVFLRGLSDLGYVAGENYVLEVRWAEVRADLDAAAQDLVARKADVIVTASGGAAIAAVKATSSIPIIQASGADPIRTGLAGSLSRPGKNLTGFTNLSEVLSGKLLELLSEMVPRISRVGALMVSGLPVTDAQLGVLKEAAGRLHIDIHAVQISEAAALNGGIAELAQHRVEGVVVFSGALLGGLAQSIVGLVATFGLPTVYPFRHFVDYGGLMSYGVDQRERYRDAARLVDRVLKGVKPNELPLEQPAKFELVINLKTATTLGLTIPPTLLARADEVIE